MYTARQLGKLLRDARYTRGMTQEQLAARCGISRGNLSKLENGRRVRSATVATLERVANALGFEIELVLKDRDADRSDVYVTTTLREVG